MSKDLGAIIQRARDGLGWTQDELGQNIGVSQQTIAKWEAGKSYPRPKALEKLVVALKINGADVRQSPARNKGQAFLDKLPEEVMHKLIGDPEVYPPAHIREQSSLPQGLPSSFPMGARFNHIANSSALKKALRPVVDSLEPSSQWDTVVGAQFGNLRVDYMNDELYAKLLHAPNTMILSSHLRTTIYRMLWRFMTLSLIAKDQAKYQFLIITLPEDQPLDFIPDDTGRYVPPVSNTRMLRRLASEALAHEIHIVLARTPSDVVSILTNPSSIYDPGWVSPGHEWDENPDD